jgi:hypothetical protein
VTSPAEVTRQRTANARSHEVATGMDEQRSLGFWATIGGTLIAR